MESRPVSSIDGSNFFGITHAVVNTHSYLHISVTKKFNAMFMLKIKSSCGGCSCDGHRYECMHMKEKEDRITKILVMSHVLYNLCSTCVDPQPGTKLMLFEYAKGLPADVAESDSMEDRSSTYKNEIPINNSFSYC